MEKQNINDKESSQLKQILKNQDIDALIQLINQSKNKIDIIIILLTNPENEIIKDDRIIKIIYENIESLKYFLSSKKLDKKFAQRFMNYGQTHSYNYLIYILYLSQENKEFLLGKDKLQIQNGLTPLYQEIYQILGEKYKKELQTLSKKSLFENIIQTYFKKSPKTILSTIKAMLEYDKETTENIYIYKSLINFYSLPDEAINKLITILEIIKPDINQDYDQIKKNALTEIKNSLIKDIPQSEELTKQYQIPVYELKGEEFYLMVTSTHNNRNETKTYKKPKQKETSSYSLISDKHLLTYSDPQSTITLGYNTFEISQIKGIYETNAFSNEKDKQRPPRLYGPKKLINETRGFNEILYNNKTEDQKENPLQPNYVVCYDEIKPGDLLASQYFNNIPLIIIHTNCYKKRKAYNR